MKDSKFTRVSLRQERIGLAKVQFIKSRGHLVSEAYPGHWPLESLRRRTGRRVACRGGMLYELADRTDLVAELSKPLLVSY